MPIKIAALQLPAFDLPQAADALKYTLEKIEQAAREHQPHIIVTPECSYPAYVLGSLAEFKTYYSDDAIPKFAALARKHQVHLCVGLATPDNETIRNEAVLFAPNGDIIGRTTKSLLWHFDSNWFCSGANYNVFETTLGTIGIMICADGRQPEIARSLALAGAKIILDPTCWVTYGADQKNLHNPQADFMLATRAWENGVACVAADKIGLEQKTVLYAGHSLIIAPNGQKLAEGSSNEAQIVVATLPDFEPLMPSLRRPALYKTLIKPTDELNVHAVLQEAIIPSQALLRGAVAQYDPMAVDEAYIAKLIHQFALESVDIAALPFSNNEINWTFFADLTKEYPILIVASGFENSHKVACLFSEGKELARWQQTHRTPQDKQNWTLGEKIGSVVKLPHKSNVRLGVMLEADGYGPETARCLMLEGADIIIWPASPRAIDFNIAQIARTRAAENRVYILLATPLETASGLDLYNGDKHGQSMIVDPNGIIVAPALTNQAMGISAQLSVSACREKLRAPNTDVVYSRKPASYTLLV